MYICICNGVKCSDIRRVVSEEGASTVGKVYKCLGCKPECGKCGEAIRDIIVEEKPCAKGVRCPARIPPQFANDDGNKKKRFG